MQTWSVRSAVALPWQILCCCVTSAAKATTYHASSQRCRRSRRVIGCACNAAHIASLATAGSQATPCCVGGCELAHRLHRNSITRRQLSQCGRATSAVWRVPKSSILQNYSEGGIEVFRRLLQFSQGSLATRAFFFDYLYVFWLYFWLFSLCTIH